MPRKNESAQAQESVLTRMLHLIARATDGSDTLQRVLDEACVALHADGAVCVVFNSPRLRCDSGTGAQWQASDEQLHAALETKPSKAAAALGSSQHTIARPLASDGEVYGGLYLLYAAQPSLSADDPLLAAVTDALVIITSRIRRQESRARAHQLTLSALNTIPHPVLVLDDQRCVVLMNPAAESVFGVTTARAVSLPFHDIVQSEPLVSLVEEQRPLAEWSPDDGEHVYSPRLEPVRAPGGTLEGYVLALHDITRFKKLNRNQAEFMRIVSHDLRSPLTSMQGFANMLELSLAGEMNDRQLHFVSKILSGITQITALVDNIQDAGRYDPETGFYEMTRSHVDLNEMVSRIVDGLLIPAEKQLSIRVSVDNAVPIINADSNMLERAITNLVDNAIKYTPTAGEIDVAVNLDRDRIVVSVRDTGLGISPEHQKQLFQRHVRIPRQEHKKIKGSGLGLFIVRSVAQRHGGDAWVESAEGQGSTFSLGIPLGGDNALLRS